MGKKVKVQAEDSILGQSFKYERRKKEKIIEKAKLKESQDQEKAKQAEMKDIEAEVDRKILEQSHLNTLKRQQPYSQLQKRLIVNAGPAGEIQSILPSTTYPNIPISQPRLASLAYETHFSTPIEQCWLYQEERQNIAAKIELETRQQIKDMFGVTKQDQQIDDGQVKEEQPFGLKIELKQESIARIGAFKFNISNNFLQFTDRLAGEHFEQIVEHTALKNYFDCIRIENKQQSTIEEFRKTVVAHCLRHLDLCKESSKSKGFTNGKILILTPFVGDARSIMDNLEEDLVGYVAHNREKFDELQDENDFFRLGIRLLPQKKKLNYFSNFDSSDIIIGSPVGLKAIIGAEGDSKRENSFLSSVQILYLDRASAMLMQNWSHIVEVFKNINHMAKYSSLKNSFAEIRPALIEQKGGIFRQNIVFSEYNFPELNALKMQQMHNYQGSLNSKVYYAKPLYKSPIERHFYKIELKEPRDDLTTRLDYFKRKFWDNLHNRDTLTKVVIFVSSYFEYVKLKSFFEKVNASFEGICEHSSKNKVQSRLARFNNEEFRILLITERAYYYQLCEVKKFEHLYFYSLPRNAFVFQELIESIHLGKHGNEVTCIYTKFDMMVLEKLVGTGKALEMVRDYCNNVSFIV